MKRVKIVTTLGAVTLMMMRTLGLEESEEGDEVVEA